MAIIVLEPDEETRERIREALIGAGYTVQVFDDVEKVVEILRQDPTACELLVIGSGKVSLLDEVDKQLPLRPITTVCVGRATRGNMREFVRLVRRAL